MLSPRHTSTLKQRTQPVSETKFAIKNGQLLVLVVEDKPVIIEFTPQ